MHAAIKKWMLLCDTAVCTVMQSPSKIQQHTASASFIANLLVLQQITQ